MKKLLIRILLITAAAVVLLLIFRNRLPFGRNNSSFAVEAHKEITGIELSDKEKKLLLERKGDKWIINGGLEARKSGILFILRILREIKIKSPVSRELFESEITTGNIDPVRVRVFENRRIIKSFLVYKTSSNAYGNIMKIRERSKPFIVYIPGYEGNIGSGFIPDELFWQPYTVFNLLPSEISSVSFDNLADTASSFKITSNNNHYTLSASGRNLTGWDSSLVRRYISYFARIPFEKWELEMGDTGKREIESQQPLFIITVTTADGSRSVLSLWEKTRIQDGTIEKDSDRLFGRTEKRKDFFVIRYFDIDPLLKKRSYFFPE